MELTAAEYEFAERLNEQCTWKPKYLPRKKEAHLIGQRVHVTWQAPTLMRAGTLRVMNPHGPDHAEPVFSIQWYGYVQELDRQVPGEELERIPMKDFEHG